jgi:hypothetical protein
MANPNLMICTDMECEAHLIRLLVAVACYMSTLHECSQQQSFFCDHSQQKQSLQGNSVLIRSRANT